MIPFAFFRHLWLAAGLVIALVTVGTEAPTWICFFATMLVTTRIMIDFQIIKPIPKWSIYLIAVALFIEVLVQFRSVFDQDSSTTLLLGLCALKILDFETKRDIKFLFILGLLVLSLKPLYSLELTWIVPLFAAFFCLWMGLMGAQQRPRWVILAKLVGQSLPIALLLFFVFPRIIVPWAQRKGAPQGVVGFSENMDPGATASISSQLGLAFRVQFENKPAISSKSLYWRGTVLQKSFGLKWEPAKFHAVPDSDIDLASRQPGGTSPPLLRYQILLEPDSQNYLFLLDHPETVYAPTEKIVGSEVKTFKTISEHTQSLVYEGQSNLYAADTGAPSAVDLQIPTESSGIDGFLGRLKSKTDPAEELAELDRFFSDKSFTYTLSPGVYKDKGLSEFLFRRKKGFCQHFAGAYASIARMLKIPSRVVLGYQGGTYNSAGDFWEVSGKDAHAWVEVYLHGRWVRKDPTGLVAPLRLELGATEFFDLPEEERKLYAQDLIQHKAQFLWLSWETEFAAWWGNLNYKWTMFLLDYNTDQSHKIFLELFRTSWKWLLMGGFLAWVITRKSKWNGLARARRPLAQSLLLQLLAKSKLRPCDVTPLELLRSPQKLTSTAQEFLQTLLIGYEKQMYQNKDLSPAEELTLRKAWRKNQRELTKNFKKADAA